MTYPDAAVSERLANNFVAFKANIREVTPATREAFRIARAVWAPLFVFVDGRRIELRRYTGWLPPSEFLPELLLAQGAYDLLHQKFDSAFEHFRDAVDQYPESKAAPEALFWAGAAAYRRDNRRLASLELRWRELMSRYPDSVWAIRANVLDMKNSTEY